MMKKFLVFLLIMVYTLSSSGASINLHFCCGKLDRVSLSTPHRDGCARPKNGISKQRCCDNKQVELKIKTDQEPAAQWLTPQKAFCIPAITPLAAEHLSARFFPVHELPHGPPDRTFIVPLFIKNCVFRI